MSSQERRKSIAEQTPSFSKVIISTMNEMRPNQGTLPKPDDGETLVDLLNETIYSDDVILKDDVVHVGLTGQPFVKNGDSRKEFVCSAKLFVMVVENDTVDVALKLLDERIHHVHLDQFILSSPILTRGIKEKSYQNALESIKPLWLRMEQLRSQGQIDKLGITDLDLTSFEKFLKCICDRPIHDKPHVDVLQIPSPWEKSSPFSSPSNVKLEYPKDLVKIAKDNHVTILTHHDPSPILSDEALSELLGCQMKVLWVLRFTAMVKDTGILSQRGYIVSGIRV